MSEIGVGIIGLGVGFAHLRSCLNNSRCKVLKVCDFDESKLAEVRASFEGVDVTTKSEEVLSDRNIDAVLIASYDNYHYEQIMSAIGNGKHVFVEKPLCQFEHHAREIRAGLNDVKSLRLSSNLILRRYLRMQSLKAIFDSGRFGRVYYIEADYNYGRLHKITEGWRGQMDYYSVVAGGGIHMIDLILWLTGKKVVEVFSYGNKICTENTGFRFKDIVVSLLKFEDGMIAKISSNFSCVFPHFHNVAVYGTDSTFVNDFDYGKLFTKRDSMDGIEKIESPYKGIDKGDYFMDFIDSLFYGKDPEISEDEVFAAMSVCFAIEKSLELCKAVSVDYV